MHGIPSIRCQRQQGNRLHHWLLQGLTVVIVCGLTGGIACPRHAFGGTLEVDVTDHWEAIQDFRKVEVVIETVRLRPNPGLKFWQFGWQDLKPTVDKIDLTQYTGKRAALIFRGAVTPGSFEGLHVKFARAEGLLNQNANTVPIRSLVGPMRVAFTVESTGVTLIVLDLTVVDMHDHPPGGYELHVKGYELYANGTLADRQSLEKLGSMPPEGSGHNAADVELHMHMPITLR
jgi:hypothetical protein